AAPEAAEEVRDRCRVARDDLDRAQLSTIHAFGQALLRSLCAEAGIDPEIAVLDQLTAERRFEERWRAALEEVDPAGPDGAAIDRALGLGLRIKDLKRLGEALTERADIAARILADPPRAPAPAWNLLADHHGLLRGLPLDRVLGDDRLRAHIEELVLLFDGLDGAEEWLRARRMIAGTKACSRGVSRTGKQGNWPSRDAIEAARECAKAAGDAVLDVLAAARAEATAAVLPWVARTVLDDAERRRREGTLIFTDLILWTRDLLRGNAAARRIVRRRYDALLIDEFQDTDPWQVDIAEAFACADDARPEPGRLFMVGDPKQSIYRFRRADMAVYAAERARVEGAGGELPLLTENRRSRAVIVDWVNRVVGAVIGDEPDPAIGPPYVPIVAERDGALAGPGVGWMGGPSDERAWDIRRREAEDVAATCRAVLDQGWQVQERDGTVRRARLRDVAVLLPARTGLSAIERALRAAAVPFRVEGGSLVFRTQELRDLINCLTAIDDPSDEVAVIGALRSTAFACSDVELAEHRRAGLRFNPLASALEGRADRVSRALLTLRAHHRERLDRSLAAVVERFVAERMMVEVGLVDAASRDAYRRARFVVEQARAFEADRPQGLRAFVAWLEERTAGPIFDRDGAGLDDDEDAVRILTIHAAKGLEFPIAILAGIGPNPAYARPPTVSVGPGGDVVVVVGRKDARFGVGDVDAAAAREERHQRAEAARLLYVGATRARDHLVMSLWHSATYATRGGARRLLDAGAAEAAPEWSPPALTGGVAAPPFADLLVEPAAEPDPSGHRAARAALVARARLRRFTSATGIAAAAAETREPGERTGDEPWARGRGGTRVGRAVHASLQSLALDAPDDAIAAVAAAQAVAEAVPERADEVERLVRAGLASQAAGRARMAPGALREVPFALSREGVVVEGFIDLVVPTLTGLEIIDWKTDDVATRAQAQERLRGYEVQAGLYAHGLRIATGRPVETITYVFLRPGLELSPGDPDALAAAALGDLGAVSG
ncbi:MAG TPA: UvrD-helicase domain-containing protein, partial [Miltoncostaeaceae bacterium]|nr:UvrD-helicase domain-containing protein [Miltoncostaeaceae bacterium]